MRDLHPARQGRARRHAPRSTSSARWSRPPDGREIPFEIDPVIRERLLNGWDDIALTLAHEDEIARYEARARARGAGHHPLRLSGPPAASRRGLATSRARQRREPASSGRRGGRVREASVALLRAGTGSAPRWSRWRARWSTRWPRTTAWRSPGTSTWSAERRSTPTAPRSPTRCSRPAPARTPSSSGAVGRPEVGHHRPRQAAPRAGAAGAARGPRPLRQPAARAPVAGALRGQPAAARAHRGHRPAGGARADRRALLRRARPRARRAPSTPASTRWPRSTAWPSGASAPRPGGAAR